MHKRWLITSPYPATVHLTISQHSWSQTCSHICITPGKTSAGSWEMLIILLLLNICRVTLKHNHFTLFIHLPSVLYSQLVVDSPCCCSLISEDLLRGWVARMTGLNPSPTSIAATSSWTSCSLWCHTMSTHDFLQVVGVAFTVLCESQLLVIHRHNFYKWYIRFKVIPCIDPFIDLFHTFVHFNISRSVNSSLLSFIYQ